MEADYRQIFMEEAITLSRQGIERGEGGPFGCVIVRSGQIIGRGWNQVLLRKDPTAHAEVMAIRNACAHLNTHQLTDCDIYTSCEPCPMCLGAIYWARPSRVYYANTRQDAAEIGFDDSFIYDQVNVVNAEKTIPFIKVDHRNAMDAFRIWHKISPGKLY